MKIPLACLEKTKRSKHHSTRTNFPVLELVNHLVPPSPSPLHMIY